MKNSANDAINAELAKVLPGAMHYNFAFPWDRPGLHLVDGRGHFVEDVEGSSYIDFFSKFGASFLGHKNQRYAHHMATKIADTLTAVDHFGDDERRIVDKLVAAVPGAEQVRFSLSGTEAVHNALRAARAYTGKDKIIRFDGHYHGSADDILGGIATQPSYKPYERIGDPRGTAGRAANAFDSSLLLPWNDISALRSVLEARSDIAAVIMEPLCINGGGIAADPDYFPFLKSAAEQHGLLIIFDEVITGFRLGYGSIQERLGMTPDIWIFGKAIGGGSLPVSCFMSSTKIMDQFAAKHTTHGGTFNGYTLGLHAIDIMLDILGEPDVYARVLSKAEELRQVILTAAKSNSIELAIQGDPLAMCLHASAKALSSGSEWTAEMKQKETIIRESFAKAGIIVAPPCRIYPTIALDDEVIDAVRQRLDSAFKYVGQTYRSSGYV